jgi:hypothetical protein
MPFKTGVTPEHKPGGYPRMSCGPQVNKFVHILVAEAALGRLLKKDEHVHHKDGDVKNPHWSNLLVMKDTIHNAVSIRQYWYLKQKFSREDAAWKAYFDVTGRDVNDENLRVPIMSDAASQSQHVSA